MNARPRQQPGAQLKREPVPWGQNTPGTFPEGKALRNQSYFSTVTHCVIRQLLIMPGPEARTLLVSSRADWPRIKHKHPRIPSNRTCYETRWTTVKGRFGGTQAPFPRTGSKGVSKIRHKPGMGSKCCAQGARSVPAMAFASLCRWESGRSMGKRQRAEAQL